MITVANLHSPMIQPPARSSSLLAILLGLGFGLLVLIGITIVFLVNRSAEDARAVVHTIDVQNKLSNLLLGMRRTETGQRGYLLTGREEYLTDYREAAPTILPLISELVALTADNPTRKVALDRMAEISRDKLAEMAKTIELQDAHQPADALALVDTGQGLSLMQEMRNLVEAVVLDEGRLLQERSGATQRNNMLLLIVALAGAVLIAVIGAISIYLVQRTARQRESARNELATMNANLEEIVAHRTADLTEANEEIQRFAYIVSHDLRSPLVNIMGFTTELEALRKDIFERMAKLREQLAALNAQAESAADAPAVAALGEDFDEAVSFIKTSITKMDRLINAVLRLSREGRREFRPETLDMRELFEGVIRNVAHRATEQGATIVIEQTPPVVSDRLALEQIFSNLVDNALKYSRDDVPNQIEIKGRTTATHVIYEVRDRGRGIDPHDHQRVFELFRRSGPQDRPGEGIGLAHVRALVRRLGGTMGLTSDIGKGSVFTVTLPRRWVGENRRVA